MKKKLKAAGIIMAFCMMVCIMCMGKTMQVQAATKKTLFAESDIHRDLYGFGC